MSKTKEDLTTLQDIQHFFLRSVAKYHRKSDESAQQAKENQYLQTLETIVLSS